MKLILLSSNNKPQEKETVTSKLLGGGERNIDEAQIVTKMFEEGLQAFHFRKKEFSNMHAIEYLNKIPSKYHDKIVLHTHHNLSLKFKIRGIHFSNPYKQQELKSWVLLKWFRYKNKELKITTSFNKLTNLLENEDFIYDYVFLTPIFDTLTGNFSNRIQEKTLKSILEHTNHQVIARGGVTIDKVEQVYNLGFVGLVAHSTIWKATDPLSEYISFKEQFKKLGIPME